MRKKDKETQNGIPFLSALKSAGIVLLSVLVFLIVGLYFVLLLFCKGPSPSAGAQLAMSLRETSALKFIANLYYSDDEIDAMYETGQEISSYDLSEVKASVEENDEEPIPLNKLREGATDDPDIYIFDITGTTYNGKVMLITDPSRLFVGTLDAYGSDKLGKQLTDFISDYDAIAGINAGGFIDTGGQGNGGTPDGIVIENGEIKWGNLNTKYTDVVGFTADYKLVVGDMTGREALEKGIVSGVSFDGGPVILQNGVPTSKALKNTGSLNPRTAIGQRADGTIILVVINGRSIESMGASFRDLLNIMTEYGAVNAANLDGGSSSALYFNGQRLTDVPYVVGTRRLPDCILVKRRATE